MFDQLKLYFREMSDFSRLFDEKNAAARRLVFYSERDIYYQYYEGLIRHLLEHSDVEFTYLTSDPSDPLFKQHHERMRIFYINQLLPAVLKKLTATALVMTMPDLGQFHLKRSPGTKHHVYLFHAIVSAHLQYRSRAFEHYDTIFCVGPHHVRELRREEELYGISPRTLVETGYHRLEKIYRDHQAYRAKHAESGRKVILVAPTWGESSMLEICPDELIGVLAKTGHDVFIRPHPEFLKRRPDEVSRLRKAVSQTGNIQLETDMISDANIHRADILITDRSGIAYEYAFGTERPVLFIDTPLKVSNPEYQHFGIEPLEISSRNALGISVGVQEIARIPGVVADFCERRESFRQKIVEYRNATIFNWMKSAEVEGEYVLGLLQKG